MSARTRIPGEQTTDEQRSSMTRDLEGGWIGTRQPEARHRIEGEQRYGRIAPGAPSKEQQRRCLRGSRAAPRVDAINPNRPSVRRPPPAVVRQHGRTDGGVALLP